MTKILSDVIIIGAGVGGLTAARLLEQGGYKVSILETGSPRVDVPPFSSRDIFNHYKYAGFQLIYGHPLIASAEAQVVGGGMSVNAGLLQRPMNTRLDEMCERFKIAEWTRLDRDADFKIAEQILPVVREIPVTGWGDPIKKGADQLSWMTKNIDQVRLTKDQRNSIADYFIKSKNTQLSAGVRIETVKQISDQWVVEGFLNDERVAWKAKKIIFSAGAIGTPKLLSKIEDKLMPRNFKFKFHIFNKVAAYFDQDQIIHDRSFSSIQIKQFAPSITLGCSITTPHLIRSHLSLSQDANAVKNEEINNWGLYYSMSTMESWSNLLTWKSNSFNFLNLSRSDKVIILNGSELLIRLLKVSRANDIKLAAPVRLSESSGKFKISDLALSTVHLFSSLRIGESEECLLDSYGGLKGMKNAWVCDAGAIPDCPGVNPQLLTMALALRISRHISKV